MRTSADNTIRIRKSPQGEWQSVRLLGHVAGWVLAQDETGAGLWVMLLTDHVHPEDIVKLFASGMTEAHKEKEQEQT